ncbi:MAG: phosphoribosylglycinamide formyltransferase 1 [Thermoleophilaceae bacterium]|nr:phosphoribosylglycinamide formyltransferase 1 [Thermoleophilaceae bacterium]
MSLRVGVLVSGEGSNLQALIDSVHRHGVAEIVCVGSNNPEARGLVRAGAAGIETGVFAVSGYGQREDRDRALADWLAGHGVELIVLAGFMELLGEEFVRRFAGRVVNVHPSLLPAFPGVHAIEQAIDYGARVMGVTVHFVDEGVDSGPIVLQEAFDAVPFSRDIAALERRVHEIEHRLLPRAVELIAAGRVRIDPDRPRRVIVEEPDGHH